MDSSQLEQDEEQPTPAVDGRVMVQTSSDRLEVKITAAFPHSGDGTPITAETIHKALEQKKITQGINPSIIDEVLDLIEGGKDANQLPAIAKGTPAKEGKDAELKWELEIDQQAPIARFITPGQVLLSYTPAAEGEDGVDVCGNTIRARPVRKELVNCGENVKVENSDSGESIYLAQCLGVAEYAEGTLSVKPVIRIAEDKLQAFLELPPLGDTKTPPTLTSDIVLSAIAERGINTGLQDKAIESSVKESETWGSSISVAQAILPIHGEDGSINWDVDISNSQLEDRAVVPGQRLATITLPTEEKAGTDVCGTELPATAGTRLELDFDAGILAQETKRKVNLRATIYGILERDEEEKISVVPPLEISEDRMEARVKLFSRSAGSEKMQASLKHVVEMLEDQGVVFGIDNKIIEENLKTLAADEQATFIETIVARGRQPENGIAARVELEKQQSVGAVRPDGSIDFRERSYPWNVTADSLLGRYVEAIPEQPGMSIFGEEIPALPPESFSLGLTNVRQDEDGSLYAETNGALLVNQQSLSVSDVLVIDGDVNLKTGNIRSDSAILVKGNIEAGMEIESTSDVIVNENAEDAQVLAQGNVIARAGIRGKKCQVRAGEHLQVNFAESAKLTAGGEVRIESSAINANISSDEKVTVGDNKPGNAAVIGGALKAVRGIEAQVLGAPSQVKTKIEIAPPERERKELEEIGEAIEELNTQLADVAKVVFHLEQNPTLPNREELLDRANSSHDALSQDREALKTKKSHLSERLQNEKPGEVTVYKCVYPGVIISIGGVNLSVTSELGPGKFRLKEDKIVFITSR